MKTEDLLKEVKRKINVLNDAIAHFPDSNYYLRRKCYLKVLEELNKINKIESEMTK